MGFSTTVWEWYGQDEYKRVLAVGEAIDALGFLALDAGAQQASIPDCAACEAWSMAMLPLQALLATCASALPGEVRAGVQNLWDLCNGLSEAAFHCGDREIFGHGQWQSLREAARQLLGLMEEQQLRPFLEELMVDCRRALYGLKS
ncbi:hypothetical protein GV819_07710 [Pseudomonas sp. Fl5BN2]|uniref:hypothetical protein n=1 Tax=unclassified Pseudomonas TaxID=196821 RepID=UPI001378203D|nr:MULTISPECIES: hypothetical protein [unclassified Pseudomonas]NBF02177.1 hypothetical protein [Pseudomonas sp. Fl5BN2]NBF07884.1 hypothetical protein [Pseudomonas sp. Fl4BN1]